MREMQRRRDCGRYVFRPSPRRVQLPSKGAGRPPKSRRGKLSKSTEANRLRITRRCCGKDGSTWPLPRRIKSAPATPGCTAFRPQRRQGASSALFLAGVCPRVARGIYMATASGQAKPANSDLPSLLGMSTRGSTPWINGWPTTFLTAKADVISVDEFTHKPRRLASSAAKSMKNR